LSIYLANADIVDFPETTVTERYACFENDFEAYCRSVVGDEFFWELRDRIAQAHGYDKPSYGLKNYEIVAELVLEMYEQGHRLPIIEDIIRQVEALI